MLVNQIELSSKAYLAKVVQAAGSVISIEDAAAALDIDNVAASRRLSLWSQQGWLRRIKRGMYTPIPIASSGGEQVVEDPWVLIPDLFGYAYVGGWSAAEYWELTEQIFRGICVFTTKQVREKEEVIQGITFVTRQIKPEKLFDLKPVWREQTKVFISSPEKTIIDMLDTPEIGGGIRHISDCLQTYLQRDKADVATLIKTAKQQNNGAVLKRLGFLLERIGSDESVLNTLREQLTQGNAKLDPALNCPRLISRWRLLVPENWLEGDRA